MSQIVSVDLLPDTPVVVPTLDAEVTLTNAKTSLHKDPESGRKYHVSSGTLQFKRGERVDEVGFGPGKPIKWEGRVMAMRGMHGWYELVIQPAK